MLEYQLSARVSKVQQWMIDENSELVSIYYGEGMSEEDAQELAEAVTASHAGIECEVNYGGQPVYYYIVSVE